MITASDDQEQLTQLTMQWAQDRKVPWPALANRRLFNYMHQNDCYDPKDPAFNLSQASRVISEGSAVHKPQRGVQKSLEGRVVSRANYLQDLLRDQGIIEFVNNKWQKTVGFQAIWRSQSLQQEDSRLEDMGRDQTASRPEFTSTSGWSGVVPQVSNTSYSNR